LPFFQFFNYKDIRYLDKIESNFESGKNIHDTNFYNTKTETFTNSVISREKRKKMNNL